MRKQTLRARVTSGIAALFLLTAGQALAANIVVVSFDGPGVGLNDPTPATPVGGNPGTTLGQQRDRHGS